MNHWIAKITAAAKRLSTPQEAMVLYLLAGTLGLLYGCASTPDSVYKLYPGPARPDSEIVTLHLGSATEAVIDGMKVSYGDYGSVELLPGPHEIQWKAWFAFSVLVEPSGFSTRKSNLFVDLKAGDAEAQLQLYYAERRDRSSLKWLCRAAEQGQRHAQNELASEYRRGIRFVKRNLVQAYVWYSLAVQGGAIEYRDRLEELTAAMTPEQIDEAERQLDAWTPGQCERDLVGSND